MHDHRGLPSFPTRRSSDLWTPPLAIDPFDHNTVYYGCQVIFKTNNGGQSWTVISPDLSTQEDRKSTRLNSSHITISYAVFCLKKKKIALLTPIHGQAPAAV